MINVIFTFYLFLNPLLWYQSQSLEERFIQDFNIHTLAQADQYYLIVLDCVNCGGCTESFKKQLLKDIRSDTLQYVIVGSWIPKEFMGITKVKTLNMSNDVLFKYNLSVKHHKKLRIKNGQVIESAFF